MITIIKNTLLPVFSVSPLNNRENTEGSLRKNDSSIYQTAISFFEEIKKANKKAEALEISQKAILKSLQEQERQQCQNPQKNEEVEFERVGSNPDNGEVIFKAGL